MGFANTPAVSSNPEFRASGTYAEAQAGIEIQEACDARLSYYITNIVISTEVAGWIQLMADIGGTPVELIPPIYLGDNASGGPTYPTSIKVPAGCNIGVASSVVGNHSVMICGYLAG